jgi:hypothetical protein
MSVIWIQFIQQFIVVETQLRSVQDVPKSALSTFYRVWL